MKIEPFGVEEWMNAWETKCAYNLAETCVASLSVAELLEISGHNEGLEALLPMRLTYGAIAGSERLRTAIAGHYDRASADDVLVTHGAIGANALVYQALVDPGDRVVSVVPSYQQHTSIPKSLGAVVKPVWLSEAQGWTLDFDALAAAARGAKMITLTNPNNPTGALLDAEALARIAEIARAADAYVLADEVYRGTDQTGPGTTASIADVYEKGVSTGSMSKAFSLAGLRLGWIVAPGDVLAAAMTHRDYSTISVGMIDDHFASLALEAKAAVLERSRGICRANAATVQVWLDGEPALDWVRPGSGTTALIRYRHDVPSHDFCVGLLEQTGVLLTPGSALGVEGTVRIGYACGSDVLAEGLPRISDYLTRLGS